MCWTIPNGATEVLVTRGEVESQSVKRLFFILILVLLAQPSASRNRRKKVTAQPAETQLSAPEARRLSYFFQAGIRQKLASHLSEAHDLFQHCLSIDPTNADALYELGYLQFYLGQDSLGTAMLRRAADLAHHNPQYMQALAAVYLAQNQYDEAIPIIERLAQLQTRRSDVLYQLVELYKANGRTDEALSALDRIELLEGRTLQTSLQKYALYIDKNQREQAFNVLEDMQRESPYDLRIPIIRGRRYLENDEPGRALECFQSVAETDPENIDLRLAMMDYYAQTDQPLQRQALRDSLLYGGETPDELRVQLATTLIEDLKDAPDRNKRILHTLDTLLRLSPSPLMHTLHVHYLITSQADEDTIVLAMRQLLKVNPTNENALSRLLVHYLSKRDMAGVAEICRMGINASPSTLTYYFYLSIALSQTGQTEQAISVLQSGLKQVNEQSPPEGVSDIYEMLGELYHEQGHTTEAFAAYDSCLVYKDDNVACLNNYAYYLSLRGERLDDAERMAYRAIKLEPLNKTYLDTYAWVLFMQENYTMSKYYIDRVISPTQSDSLLLADEALHADVLEHAGDIYALNGLEETALRYWSLALQKGEASALLQKKLKLKKYVRE